MNAESTKKKSSLGTVVIGVAGSGLPQSIFDVAAGRSIRAAIPENFTAEHVALAARDSELLMGMLKNHPHEFCEMVNAINTGKFTEARKMAEKVGLTEENIISQGGGLWAVVIVIAVAAALLLAHD
jgi:hypothetical protein